MKTRPSISRKSRLLRKMRTRTPIFPVQRKKITLVDTVSFKGLVPNQKYEVTGTLIDKETKKPVEADGKPVTAKASFKPKESAGTVDVTFTFDASSLKGKTVVVFESLAYKDKEVAVHTDIADEGQTIYFPEIKTTATDAASGTHYAKPEKELTLTDLVEYKNLIPGKEYKLTGTLMDRNRKTFRCGWQSCDCRNKFHSGRS